MKYLDYREIDSKQPIKFRNQYMTDCKKCFTVILCDTICINFDSLTVNLYS